MAAARTRSARWVFGVVAFVSLSWLTPGSAQAQVNSGKVSFNTGVDMSHAYFFRGMKQEREGFIAQPYADINFNVFSDEDASGLQAVTFTVGQWNSLHSGPTGSDGPAQTTAMWYESNFYTGFSLDIDNWEAGITYTSYLSPNGSFGTTQELALGLNMDDEAILGTFAMNPHVLLAIEMSGGRDGGASEGVYLELGAEPGMDIAEDVAYITFPITLGLSLSNYYENGIPEGDLGHFSDGFGFFSLGAAVGFPLPVSENYGSWELTGSLQFMTLGSYLQFLNEDDGGQVIGAFGFSIGY